MSENGIVIKRDFYLRKLNEKKENGRVKILTGIKGCGKTFLLFNLYRDYLLAQGVKQEQIVTIALDDPANLEYRTPLRLNEYIKSQTPHREQQYYVFIDEIQFCEAVSNLYVDSKEQSITFVDVLLGQMKRSNVDVYVIGSYAKLLVSEVPTQLRDRVDRIHVSPLSFAEVRDFYVNTELAWEHYCLYGGMPYIYSLASDAEKQQYLQNLFKETYLQDILARNNIQNDQEILEALLDFTADTAGELTNPTQLAERFWVEKQIKISSHTLNKYLGFLEEAFVLAHAQRYEIKKSKYFSTPLKYYFPDIGLRNVRLNFKQGKQASLLENIVYNELLRRGFEVDIGFVIHDSKKDGNRSKVQLEVDFVLNRGHQRFYIQVVEDVDSAENIEQATTPLKKIRDSFRKIVVVNRPIIPRHDDYGIFYVGAEEFLLNEAILSF